MRTKRISNLLLTAILAMIMLSAGCANRYQRKVDEAMLIQENLQLDQALSIAQYELELTRQENVSLRQQLENNSSNYRGGNSSHRNGNSSEPLPPLRTNPDSAPSFNRQENFDRQNNFPREEALPPPNSPENLPPLLRNQSALPRPNYHHPLPIQQTSGVIDNSSNDFPEWLPYRK